MAPPIGRVFVVSCLHGMEYEELLNPFGKDSLRRLMDSMA